MSCRYSIESVSCLSQAVTPAKRLLSAAQVGMAPSNKKPTAYRPDKPLAKLHLGTTAVLKHSQAGRRRLGFLGKPKPGNAQTRSRRLGKRLGPLALFGEAIKGARLEIATIEGPVNQIKVGTALGFTILKEFLGLAKVVPYGYHAYRTYRKLQAVPGDGTEDGQEGKTADTPIEAAGELDTVEEEAAGQQLQGDADEKEMKVDGSGDASQKSSGAGWGWWPWGRDKPLPSIVRDVAYGPRERNKLDIYVPARGAREGPLPVVVFIHGGVWASGDKWQYSPLGTRCAEEGAIAVLIQYTLYPEVLAEEQVREASAALSWTMDNIGRYGGNPARIFLMGHSSGAHVGATMLWERAKWRLLGPRPAGQGPAPGDAPSPGVEADLRQPHCFVGLSGVYDIAEHYRYEQKRGVAAVSCMRPANGGLLGFPSMSPSLLLQALGRCLEGAGEGEGEGHEKGKGPAEEERRQEGGNGGSEGGEGGVGGRRGATQGCGCVGKKTLRGEGSVASSVLGTPGKNAARWASLEEATPQQGAGLGRDDSQASTGAAAEANTANGEGTPVQPAVAAAAAQTLAPGSSPSLGSPGIGLGVEGGSRPVVGPLRAHTPSKQQQLAAARAQESCRPLSEFTRRPESLTRETAAAVLGPALKLTGLPTEELIAQVREAYLREVVGPSRSWQPAFLLPPCLLLCSAMDTTVPPTTSFALGDALQELGHRVKVVCYDNVDHGAFACWNATRGKRDPPAVAPLCSDVLDIVTERIPLEDLKWVN